MDKIKKDQEERERKKTEKWEKKSRENLREQKTKNDKNLYLFPGILWQLPPTLSSEFGLILSFQAFSPIPHPIIFCIRYDGIEDFFNTWCVHWVPQRGILSLLRLWPFFRYAIFDTSKRQHFLYRQFSLMLRYRVIANIHELLWHFITTAPRHYHYHHYKTVYFATLRRAPTLQRLPHQLPLNVHFY